MNEADHPQPVWAEPCGQTWCIFPNLASTCQTERKILLSMHHVGAGGLIPATYMYSSWLTFYIYFSPSHPPLHLSLSLSLSLLFLLLHIPSPPPSSVECLSLPISSYAHWTLSKWQEPQFGMLTITYDGRTQMKLYTHRIITCMCSCACTQHINNFVLYCYTKPLTKLNSMTCVNLAGWVGSLLRHLHVAQRLLLWHGR